MAIPSKLMYTFNKILMKILPGFFTETYKMILYSLGKPRDLE